MIRSLLVPPMTMVALSACTAPAHRPAVARSLQPAIRAPLEVVPVQIVEVATPLPLPGQLLPIPPSKTAIETAPPAARVTAANRAALREPSSHGYMNAVQVYPWTEGALYRLYAAPERVTDIALQAGERLIAIAAGDTVRWTVGDTSSGSRNTKRAHILVKPFAPALKTNLVITTDRRSYHLQLESTAHTAMAAISWTYPQDSLFALEGAAAAAEAALPLASGVVIENLRFGYTIRGDDPPWRPLRAFDDGRQVFIELAPAMAQGEAPPLFVLGPKGDAQLVNYRVSGRFYIVDRLFEAAELRLGATPQQVVRISRGEDTFAGKRRRRRGS